MKRFKDYCEGTLTDTVSGLMWQKQFTNPLSWAQAVDYAKKLGLAGYTDWRLPTVKELLTLVDYSKRAPASSFPGMPLEWFWSSSSYVPNSDESDSGVAWVVSFLNGSVSAREKSYCTHIRCVRGQ